MEVKLHNLTDMIWDECSKYTGFVSLLGADEPHFTSLIVLLNKIKYYIWIPSSKEEIASRGGFGFWGVREKTKTMWKGYKFTG
jgi:hypothetical protein